MNPNHITASRLKQLRENKGLNQEQFAKAFCEFINRKEPYSIMTISNWETGRKLPPADTIIYLAHFYGATSDYILGLSSDSSLLRTSSEKNSSQLIEIPYVDLVKYNGNPVYVQFPDTMFKNQYGLIDYNNRCIVTLSNNIQISPNAKYFITMPPEELTIRNQMGHLLNLKDVKRADYVYVKSLSPDTNIAQLYEGWYHNDVSEKFLINDLGRTLSYEGLGVTYNAFAYKHPTKKK